MWPIYFISALDQDSLLIGSVQIASTSFLLAKSMASINELYEHLPAFFETIPGFISKSPFVL